MVVKIKMERESAKVHKAAYATIVILINNNLIINKGKDIANYTYRYISHVNVM